MRVAFRMEGSHRIGMGHVMRCLTLGRALAAQGDVVLFLCSRDTARAVRAYWQQAKCVVVPHGLSETQEAARCRGILRKQGVDWLVVDHYQLGARFERAVKGATRVLAMDDIGRRHDAEVVLDTGLDGNQRYCGKVRGQGWFGPRYALLRPGVLRSRRAFSQAHGERVFVSFGGADPADMTRRTARAMAGAFINVDFVVGYAYQGKEALMALCQRQKGWKLHVNHAAPEMLMAQAAVAIGAGGGMTWERAAVGVPSVVVSIADNQVAMSEALAAKGIIRYLGSAEALDDRALVAAVQALLADAGKRAEISAAGRAMVDGRGAMRVARRMRACIV